jgi:hypothetical protein
VDERRVRADCSAIGGRRLRSLGERVRDAELAATKTICDTQ